MTSSNSSTNLLTIPGLNTSSIISASLRRKAARTGGYPRQRHRHPGKKSNPASAMGSPNSLVTTRPGAIARYIPPMPTVSRSGPYRFYFYSHEPSEPPHIHVDRDDSSAKFWTDPVQLAANFGFRAHELREYNGWCSNAGPSLWRHGMSFSEAGADERVLGVEFNDDALSVSLHDGRIITVPLVWYPRLLNATAAQRQNWKIAGGGYGLHWPDLDEDLSTEGFIRGAPAPKAHITAK